MVCEICGKPADTRTCSYQCMKALLSANPKMSYNHLPSEEREKVLAKLNENVNNHPLSRREIAEELDTNIYQMSRWLRGQRYPLKSTRKAINAFFKDDIFPN